MTHAQQTNLKALQAEAEEKRVLVFDLLRQRNEIEQAIRQAQRASAKAQTELDTYCRELVRTGALDLPTLRKPEPEGSTP